MLRRLIVPSCVITLALSACSGGGGGGGSAAVPVVTTAPTPVITPSGTVVTTLALSIPNPAAASGAASTVAIQATAYDVNHNVITGQYYNPITLSMPQTTGFTLQTTTIHSSADQVTAAYDGRSLVNATITSNVQNYYTSQLEYTVFRPLLPATQSSLPSGRTVASSMLAAGDGSMWISEVGGVARVQNGALSEFTETQENPYGVLVSGPGQSPWLVTSQSITPGGFTSLSATGNVTSYSAGTTVYAPYINAALGPDGNFWYADQRGVRKFTPLGVDSQAFLFSVPGNGIVYTVPGNSNLRLVDYLGYTQTCTYAGACTSGQLPPSFPGANQPMVPIGESVDASGNLLVAAVQTAASLSPSGSVIWVGNVPKPGFFMTSAPVSYQGYVWIGHGSDEAGRAIIARFASDGSMVDFVGPSEPNGSVINALAIGADGNLWFARGTYYGSLTISGLSLAPALARRH